MRKKDNDLRKDKQINSELKNLNKVYITLIIVAIACLVIFVLVRVITKSYAIFSDNKMGEKTIEVEADICNLFKPNPPLLDDNMIAVYYDENDQVWKKADETNLDKNYKWYDYCDGRWANSVTVSSSNRETYLNAKTGTTIPMDDILTMQVWIPRYKYKVWNYNSSGTVKSDPRQIEIVFEEGTEKTGEITCVSNPSTTDNNPSETCLYEENNCTDSICNNKYYTHPAFTFGDEELEGFWIGKFEVSPNSNSTCSSSPSEANCNKTGIQLLTKPDRVAYRYADMANLFYNVFNMNNSGNIYGFTTNSDLHMIKNMEWGAVVYLTFSRFGLCEDGVCDRVYKNNSTSYYTGRSGTSFNTTTEVAGGNFKYNEIGTGTNASTTHTIYGVYDMNGGAGEKTMSSIINTKGVPTVGYGVYSTSGFAGIVYEDGEYKTVSGADWPDEKYYDYYSYRVVSADSFRRGLLGDATKEVLNDPEAPSGWDDIPIYMPMVSMPFSIRGGIAVKSSVSGITAMGNRSGVLGTQEGTRFVLNVLE